MKEEGMCACSGGIIGMGESFEDRLDRAAGRALLTNDGEMAFCAGASATITGNMLTTAACATIQNDRRMLKELGRKMADL